MLKKKFIIYIGSRKIRRTQEKLLWQKRFFMFAANLTLIFLSRLAALSLTGSLWQAMSISFTFQFSRIHADSFINIEKSMNKPITKFYNADDVSVIVTKLRFTKARPISFRKKHNILWELMPKSVNKILKTNC